MSSLLNLVLEKAQISHLLHLSDRVADSGRMNDRSSKGAIEDLADAMGVAKSEICGHWEAWQGHWFGC
jgi:hypothetical protein